MQDKVGNDDCSARFGSAHANNFAVVLCDGSVQRINYGIDLRVLSFLGNRKDGQVIDAKSL
jgi:hypothetical protein